MMFYKELDFKGATAIGKIPLSWEMVSIQDICEFKRGFSYRSDQITADVTNTRFITINDYEKEGEFKQSNERLYLKDYVGPDSDFVLKKDDVLIANTDMSRGFIIGAPLHIESDEGELVYSMDSTKLIFDKKKVSGKFLFYLLRHEKMRRKVKTLAQGTNVLHLNHALAKNLRIPLPSLSEQQAIVGVLGVVDLAIAKAGEIIGKTERLKKGLMQELLTKGIGHKEYKHTPIGTVPKDWEIVKLQDLSFDLIGGGTPSTSNPDYWNGEVAWMTSAHINGRIVESGQRYITKEGLENSASNLVPKDNLLVATRVGIGKAAINKIDIAISQDLTGVIVNKDKALPDFLYWVIINNERRLKSIAQGSTIKGILREDLGRLVIPRPPLPEQRQIAEILSTVDKKLELETKEKGSLERVRQGLMDLLLTGKVRIKVM